MYGPLGVPINTLQYKFFCSSYISFQQLLDEHHYKIPAILFPPPLYYPSLSQSPLVTTSLFSISAKIFCFIHYLLSFLDFT